MNIFLTGGAGFIGSNFVRHLLNSTDDTVTVFDALTYAGNRATLAEFEDNPRFRFIHGDICDREVVMQALPGHDAVVHFAAESHVDRSLLDPDVFARTNCLGTNVLCDVATQQDIQRFVHVSTDEVYGSIESGSFVETDSLQPRSPYSASKAGSDLLALSYFESFGLPVVVTRSSNQYGPYQFPEKLIPLFTTNIMDGLNVPLYGDGGNVRDWMYVEDNCHGVDLILRKGTPGEIYNIGAGNELTNVQVTSMLFELLGVDDSRIDWVSDRIGHDRRYSIASEKIGELGWKPTTDFATGLEETVKFYADRRTWWEPLKQRVKNR